MGSTRRWWMIAASLVSTVACGAPARHPCICRIGGVPRVQPASLDFGAVTVGQTATLPLALENVGSMSLATLTQQIVDDATSSFGLARFFGGLSPGDSRASPVSFTPTQPGTLTATLFLQGDGTPESVSVPLTGTGVAPDAGGDGG